MSQFLISVEIDHEDAQWLKNVLFNIKNERARRVRDAIDEALKEVDPNL